MDEAEGSSPSSSTLHTFAGADQRLGFALAGVVAGEGTFVVSRTSQTRRDGSAVLRFVFAVSMAVRDRELLVTLQRYLGVGSLVDRPPRGPRWLPMSTYTVNGRRSHHAATIPFAERFLLTSAKRTQYEEWRDDLLAYESAHPTRWGKGPSTCRITGCASPVRGRGLCRAHYYRATGW